MLDIAAIIEANPVLLEPGFNAACDKWDRLNTIGEQSGLEPYSTELAEFVGLGMQNKLNEVK